MTFRVRLLTPYGDREFTAGACLFSTSLAPHEADGLLCQDHVYDEIHSFDGPAAWYTMEPRTNPQYGVLRNAKEVEAMALLRPEQQLHPAHIDPAFRVPHMTHSRVGGQVRRAAWSGSRIRRAAAVVGNAGGHPRDWWPDIAVRNRFVTARGVDLFGPAWLWRNFRSWRWGWRRGAPGYRGEAAAAYTALGFAGALPSQTMTENIVKIELLARYHAAICLENTVEPFYFTEKFVDAVRAGCVPIYRAHPTVRDGVLRGARWVDPSEFGMSPRRTLARALALDRTEVAAQNDAWLESAAVRATEEFAVWAQIGDILRAMPRRPSRRPQDTFRTGDRGA